MEALEGRDETCNPDVAKAIGESLIGQARALRERDEAHKLLADLVDAVAGEQEDPIELERALGKPAVALLPQARAFLEARRGDG